MAKQKLMQVNPKAIILNSQSVVNRQSNYLISFWRLRLRGLSTIVLNFLSLVNFNKIALPFILFFCFYSSSIAQTETVLTNADQMPYFPGCMDYDEASDAKRECSNLKMVQYLSNQIEYPELANQQGISGTVFVSFIISEKGEVDNAFVLKDIGGGCGEEALRIVKSFPKWEPGKHEGKTVPVKLNLPIQFSVSEEGAFEERYKLYWGNIKGKEVSKKQLKSNIGQTILLRDEFGNDISLSSLQFVFEKKKKVLVGQSSGYLNNELLKVLKKTKRGGNFRILMGFREKGQAIEIERSFQVIK